MSVASGTQSCPRHFSSSRSRSMMLVSSLSKTSSQPSADSDSNLAPVLAQHSAVSREVVRLVIFSGMEVYDKGL